MDTAILSLHRSILMALTAQLKPLRFLADTSSNSKKLYRTQCQLKVNTWGHKALQSGHSIQQDDKS